MLFRIRSVDENRLREYGPAIGIKAAGLRWTTTFGVLAASLALLGVAIQEVPTRVIAVAEAESAGGGRVTVLNVQRDELHDAVDKAVAVVARRGAEEWSCEARPTKAGVSQLDAFHAIEAMTCDSALTDGPIAIEVRQVSPLWRVILEYFDAR